MDKKVSHSGLEGMYMRIDRRNIGLQLTCMVMVCWLSGVAFAVDHPSLLVHESDYTALRNRAANSPWSDMKADAIDKVNHLNYDPGQSDLEEKAIRFTEIVSAGTLAYILDPGNKTSYLNKLKSTLGYLENLYNSRTGWDHTTQVDVGSSVFHAILSLDVIYHELDGSQRSNYEYWIGRHVNDTITASWETSGYAIKGIWALYRDDRGQIDANKNGYRNIIEGVYLTDYGIFNGGTNYANSRFCGTSRDQKFIFMDVLEHTGEMSWYNHSQVRQLYEWIFGHVHSPNSRIFAFGDSYNDRYRLDKVIGSVAAYGAHHYSAQAGRHAAYWMQGYSMPGRFSLYVLADQVSTPERPNFSKVYYDGGAWFVHNPNDQDAMAGALWNTTEEESHAHKDVNAIYLVAYGTAVMGNSGYTGYGSGDLGFDWTYIHDRAVSSNTVLINGSDHGSKRGGGISEGFVSPWLSYASGNSGGALPNGSHLRNFTFVPPQDGRQGYWILFDEVDAHSGGATANVALHPFSSQYSTISGNERYRWTINESPGHDVQFDVYLATPPNNVEIRDGLLADNRNNFVGKYTYSNYGTDGSGMKYITTLLMPHDANHPLPGLSRISGGNWTGGKVQHDGNTYDLAASILSSGTETVEGMTIDGQALFIRKSSSSSFPFYFVRKGRHFRTNESNQSGFDSDSDISLMMKENFGRLISGGTNVTLYYPGIELVILNGNQVSILDSGTDWIRFYAPGGTFDLEVISGFLPDPPSNLTATPVSGSEVQLAWQDNSDNEDGFVVERKPYGGDALNWRQVADLGVNTTSYTDTDSVHGMIQYTYRVGAYRE